jgi:hypothetical protein
LRLPAAVLPKQFAQLSARPRVWSSLAQERTSAHQRRSTDRWRLELNRPELILD